MRKFGLIGYPLTHSFSKKYFTEIFIKEGIDAVYNNYPIKDISALPAILQTERPEGLNVTIPHKEAVIPYLDGLTDAVRSIRACNCIAIDKGRTKGYNTDVLGFEISLKDRLAPIHNKAIVLGTGGASKAVCYVLEKLEIPFIVVSRTEKPGCLTYSALNKEMVAEHRLIINTTPAGMFPQVDESPAIAYDGIAAGHYLFDLVYNPERTVFLRQGEERGAITQNGSNMLVIQANESRKIWKV
jgi:shikimate dehydrogenase